jgi:hypothetical protein
MLSYNENTGRSVNIFEGVSPEEMYWYDEAFGRHSVHDSRRNTPVLTIMGEKEVLHVIRRSIGRQVNNPNIDIVSSVKALLAPKQDNTEVLAA